MKGTRQELKNLLKKASQVQKNAYAPYSKLKVGAALLGKSGKIYTGCNIENASFGLSICAERVALFKAISTGEKGYERLAISSSSKDGIIPCGACLQTLAEFAPSLGIIYMNKRGDLQIKKLKEFLPKAFNLKKLREGRVR